jgi:hypothetical protein
MRTPPGWNAPTRSGKERKSTAALRPLAASFLATCSVAYWLATKTRMRSQPSVSARCRSSIVRSRRSTEIAFCCTAPATFPPAYRPGLPRPPSCGSEAFSCEGSCSDAVLLPAASMTTGVRPRNSRRAAARVLYGNVAEKRQSCNSALSCATLCSSSSGCKRGRYWSNASISLANAGASSLEDAIKSEKTLRVKMQSMLTLSDQGIGIRTPPGGRLPALAEA